MMKQLYPPNPQWGYLTFKLQLTLGTPNVQVLNIVKHTVQFDHTLASHLKLDAFLEVTHKEENELEALRHRLTNEVVFEGGPLKISSMPQRQNVRKIMMFKIAVAQMLPIHKSGASELKNIERFPEGYDTIYVSETKEEIGQYPHRYKLKDKRQYSLQYEIQFQMKESRAMKTWDSSLVFCDHCRKKKADYYCPEDGELFCLECYMDLHRTPKKKGYGKQPINPYNATSICPFHEKDRLTYYCFDCKELRCEKCVNNPSHKNQKKHTTIKLVQLVNKFQQKEQLFLNEGKKKIEELIMKAQQNINIIQLSYKQKQTELEEMFANKLRKLRELTNAQISRVLGTHAELKRKYDQLLWVQNYMEYWEQHLIADDSIKMKQSFTKYVDETWGKEYFYRMQKELSTD